MQILFHLSAGFQQTIRFEFMIAVAFGEGKPLSDFGVETPVLFVDMYQWHVPVLGGNENVLKFLQINSLQFPSSNQRLLLLLNLLAHV